MTDRLSASYAGRLMACPGSADLTNSIPGFVYPEETEGGARAKGDLWHGILEEIVSNSNATEMAAMISALAYVQRYRAQRRFKVLTEFRGTAEWLATKPTTTADLILYLQDEIHIFDYKTGVIPVSPVNNAQLKYYAAVFEYLAPKAKYVSVHIVQPWSKSWMPSEIRIPRDEITTFREELLKTEEKILRKDTTLNPSDHCTFCAANPLSRGDKGQPYCPAVMQSRFPLIEDEEELLK